MLICRVGATSCHLSKVIRLTWKWSDEIRGWNVLDCPEYCALVWFKREVLSKVSDKLVRGFVAELQEHENFSIWHFYFKKTRTLGRCDLCNLGIPSLLKYWHWLYSILLHYSKYHKNICNWVWIFLNVNFKLLLKFRFN